MLLRSKALLALVLLAVSVLNTACSSLARIQIKRAQFLESHGQVEKALDAYVASVPHIPENDNHLRSEVYLRIGECLFRLDRLNEAFAAFQKSADTDKTNMKAHLRLGEIYLAGGAPDRAGEQAHTVLQLASANLDGLALLGAASSAAGNDRLARDAFELVLQSDPRRVSVAVALADVYNRQDHVEEARAVLRKATAAQPSSSLPWLAMGRLEEQEGNVAAAEDSYRNAISAENTADTNLRLAQFLERTAKLSEAEAVLSRVDGLRPAMPSALADFKFLAGDANVALGHYTNALRSPIMERKVSTRSLPWSNSVAAYPPSIAESRASLAARVVEADLQLAAQVREDSKLPKSTAAARLHLLEYRSELDPATVAVLQAEMALADGDLPSAGVAAQQAVALAPESAAAHYIRGVVLFRTGDRSGARAEWSRSFTEDPTYVPVRLAMADDALASGDLVAAEQAVIGVVREEPANFRGLILFARVLLQAKRYDSASVIARRAAALDSKSAEPQVLLGKIALRQDNIGAALGQFERALSLDPYSDEALQGLTLIYRRGRITRSMLANLEHVAEAAPPSAPLMEIAGRIYGERGWYDDARRCFNRSLQIDPGRTSAVAMLAELQAANGQYSAATLAGEKLGGSKAALLSAARADDQHDIETAIRAYDKAVRQGDSSGVAANNLAWIFAAHGRNLDRALVLADKARLVAPDNPSVLDTVGFVHLKRREYSKAIAVLKQANRLAMQKNFPEYEVKSIRQHLSDAYFRTGQNAEAAAVKSASMSRPR